ncbi:hypothetical protein [Aliidiomarina maris]|uniref:Phage abortive infection protein n=1 Tax=Aliidiomarina maris TaxID=531312 RepID=A0A327WVP4_9GAMM|nr:hypothetical protein [Aliidiomarina maris]RAJ97095.1 hypothetical protein B0I24_106158 [Aliidiomarina maris]RUO24695.1 hypothetical protein CWE07_08495 [Aliidiomarina maris]
MSNSESTNTLKTLIDLTKAVLTVVVASCVVVLLIYVYFAVKHDWALAQKPEHLAQFGNYLTGTVGIALAFATLFVLTLSMILQKHDNTNAIRASTQAFILNEFRSAIKEVKDDLEAHNKAFSIEQSKLPGSTDSITATMYYWDLFHGGLRDSAPGENPERIIVVDTNWNDFFDVNERLEEYNREKLYRYAVKLAKLRLLIARYLEKGGLSDVFLEEVVDAQASIKYLEKPISMVCNINEPSKVTRAVKMVYEASVELIAVTEKCSLDS